MKAPSLFVLRALIPAVLLCCSGLLQAQQGAVTVPGPTPPIQTGGEVAAGTAVEVWLALADDGQFDKSWDAAAKILQDLVAKKDWVELANTRRVPLGKVVSRKRKEITATKTLPGAPEGQYVVIQYDTEFEHKKVARETVTVALDATGGGQWKVSGYYIR